MIQIRHGVFETNSSSTHSITMCMGTDFKRWENGELYWSRWDCAFLTVEEANKKIRKDNHCVEDDTRRGDYGYYTFDEFWDYVDREYETYCESIELPNGEEVVAFGYYGNDY